MAYTITTSFGQALFDRLAPWHSKWPQANADDLAVFCDGIGSMAAELYDIVYPQGISGDPDHIAGYGVLFDVDRCPTKFLPYLGQYVGVRIPVGASDALARALIRARSGFARGTLASIQAAVEQSISTAWEPNTAYTVGQLVQNGSPPVTYKVTTGFTSGVAFDATNLAEIDITTQYQVLERFNGVASLTDQAYQMTIIGRPEQLTPAGDPTALMAAVTANKPGGIVLTTILSDSPVWSGATKTWATVTGSPIWATVTSGQV